MPEHLRSDLPGARAEESGAADPPHGEVGLVVWMPGEFGDQAWRSSAACRDVDTAVFFPVGLTGPAIQLIDEAKVICRGCPVRLVCLQYALATHQDDGVWGGYDEGERRDLRRRWRRLGRPMRFVPGATTDEVGPPDRAGHSDWTPEAS